MEVSELFKKITKCNHVTFIPLNYKKAVIEELLFIHQSALVITTEEHDLSEIVSWEGQTILFIKIKNTLNSLNNALKKIAELKREFPLILINVNLKKPSWEETDRQLARFEYLFRNILKKSFFFVNIDPTFFLYTFLLEIGFKNLVINLKGTFLEILFEGKLIYLDLS